MDGRGRERERKLGGGSSSSVELTPARYPCSCKVILIKLTGSRGEERNQLGSRRDPQNRRKIRVMEGILLKYSIGTDETSIMITRIC